MGRPKKVTTTETAPAKTSVVSFDSLKCTDGEAKPRYRSAYEIVGFKQHDYRTSNIAEYEANLSRMNLADLQSHGFEMGLLPSDNRSMLIERLLRKFREDVSPNKTMALKPESFSELRRNPEELKKVQDILSRGR